MNGCVVIEIDNIYSGFTERFLLKVETHPSGRAVLSSAAPLASDRSAKEAI
jgi:hypothetical protein